MKIIIGIISLLLVGTTQAATLTFDSTTSGTSYTEAGMTITALTAEPVRTNGGWYLDCCDSGPESFSLKTGGLFDMVSLDMLHQDGATDPLIFSGYRDGNLIAQTAYTAGYQIGYLFDASFSGLDELIFSVSGIWTDPRFDNLVYADSELSPVPVPAAAWLFGSALIGLAGIRGKKMSTSAS